MEIVANQIEVTGPHGTLLPRTSLSVRDATVLLVSTDSAIAASALALTVAGRMRPTRGSVRCDRNRDAATLRRVVSVVDVPEVSEPDGVLSVREVIAEGLSIARAPADHRAVQDVLLEHGLEEDERTRFEQLPGEHRVPLLFHLGRQRRGCRALVLDRPDRHGGNPATWYAQARQEAALGFAVLVTCAAHSAASIGVVPARIGFDNTDTSALDNESLS